jgi:hypothetical protein
MATMALQQARADTQVYALLSPDSGRAVDNPNKGADMSTHGHSLAKDIEAMPNMTAGRCQSMRWLFAGAAALPMAGCGGGGTTAATVAVPGPTFATEPSSAACAVIPEETGGP